MSSKTTDSDLTTDAYPSPPRENLEESINETIPPRGEAENCRRNKSHNKSYSRDTDSDSESDDCDNIRSPKNCSNSRRFTSKSHGGFPGPNAYASVINISNASGIHIGSNYTCIIKTSKETSKETLTKKTKNVPKTDKIKLLLDSKKPVSKEDLLFITPHIDEKWVQTARKLNYSDGQIFQFQSDFKSIGLKEVIYQCLLDWIQNNGDSATVGELAKALWTTGQEDCVLRWSEKELL